MQIILLTIQNYYIFKLNISRLIFVII